MFAVVIALGTTDLLFALDSIPAIYGLTNEAFLVLTANIFALMGLRQLYFLIGGLLRRLVYLSYGLAFLLAFIRRPLALYGTIWLLVIAFTVAFLPIAIRNIGSLFQQVGRDLEEAALVSGASGARTLQKVTIPLVMPGERLGTEVIDLLIALRTAGNPISASDPTLGHVTTVR